MKRLTSSTRTFFSIGMAAVLLGGCSKGQLSQPKNPLSIDVGTSSPSSQILIPLGEAQTDLPGAAREISVVNRGARPVENVQIEGIAPPFDAVNGCEGKRLLPGDTCPIHLSFEPENGKAYNNSAVLAYKTSATETALNLSITGSGKTAPSGNENEQNDGKGHLVSVAGPIVTFEGINFGTNPIVSVEFKNDGLGGLNARMKLTPLEPDGGRFSIVGSNCRGVGPGDKCRVRLKYSPVSVGTDVAYLAARYKAQGQEKTLTVELRGIAIDTGRAVLTISPSSYDFGTQPVTKFSSSTEDAFFTITNRGTLLAQRVNLGVGGVFRGSNECQEIAPGATCRVTMNFRPKEAIAYTTTVKIGYFNGVSHFNSGPVVTLTGTGVNAEK